MWDLVMIAAVVATEGLDVGLTTLTKAAMNRGMSEFVFVVYSNVFALLVLLPLTFIFHRTRPCPRIAFSILARIFALGILSCSVQVIMYIGIGYSSPTLGSAMLNLTPAFTFILALATRMEKLELRLHSSQAKSIGTIMSIAGAFLVTFYKGPPIIYFQSLPRLIYEASPPLLLPQLNWIIGGCLLAASSLLLALLYIVQTAIIKEYPSVMMVTIIACFFVTLQSAVVAAIAERDVNAWKLSSEVELIAIAYGAIFSVVFRSTVQTWALHKRGPVFVTMFKPLGMVFAVLLGIAFLGDNLYAGSVIGAIVIAFGFYSVLWGKIKEGNNHNDNNTDDNNDDNGRCASDSTSSTVPLLQKREEA